MSRMTGHANTSPQVCLTERNLSSPICGIKEAALERAIDYMRYHVADDTSLAQLADMAAMSERTFVRRFRDVAGMPPGVFRERLR